MKYGLVSEDSIQRCMVLLYSKSTGYIYLPLFFYSQHSLPVSCMMFPCTQFAGAIFPVLNVFVCLISPIVNCSDPTSPGNGSIETYQNTIEGAEIFYRCNPTAYTLISHLLQLLLAVLRRKVLMCSDVPACMDIGWTS